MADDPELGKWGPELPKGSYVLATKYSDGDPGDPWAVGFYICRTAWGRHLVGDGTEKYVHGYYRNGYRKVKSGLRADVGEWLISNSAILEKSPPGTVNLWTMLTDAAFEGDPAYLVGDAGTEENASD